ncbi:MAG: S41 family peptidase [Planctomycetota bacterium]
MQQRTFWISIACVLFASLGITARAQPMREAGPDRPVLDRLEQASRLTAYLRFFHPNDTCEQADWDRVYVSTIDLAMTAPDAEAFERDLAGVVASLAPTAAIGRWDEHERAMRSEPLPPPDSATSHRVWRHTGVQLGPARAGLNVYGSDRVRLKLDDAGENFPKAGTRVVRPLGSGLWISLPISVYDDGERSLPARTPEAVRAEMFMPDTVEVRVAAVAQAWGVFQHFYPYFDIVGVNWQAELRAALAEALASSDRWEGLTAMQRLVARLQDGHGRVFLGRQPGVMRLPVAWMWAEGELLTLPTVEPGPVPPGLVVESIDGVPIAQYIERPSALISSSTPGWMKYRLLEDLRHFEATEVTLGVRNAAGDRRALKVETLPPGHPDAIPELKPGPFSGAILAPGVMYFNLVGATSGQLRKELRRMAEAKGVIFDLRGYPDSAGQRVLQHLATDRVHSAWWRVPVASMPDREGVTYSESRWDLPPRRPHIGGRVVFITDGSAISYAESVMGIVEKLELGEIVGAPTAGTNGNVNPFRTVGGYSISWTGMRVEKHDRTTHHGVGALPTVYAEPTIAGLREGRDELLDLAVRLASGALQSPVLDGIPGPVRWDADTDGLVPTTHDDQNQHGPNRHSQER